MYVWLQFSKVLRISNFGGSSPLIMYIMCNKMCKIYFVYVQDKIIALLLLLLLLFHNIYTR